MRKILSVKAFDFFVHCEMENGDIYKYDMSFIHNDCSPMFAPLKQLKEFQSVFIELGSLSWPSGYDIHASTVVRDGELIQGSLQKKHSI